MNGAEFATIVRGELLVRDAARKARLFDPAAWAAADSAFVAAVAAAAGLEVPDGTEKTIRRARKARAVNEAAAFPDAS